MCIVQIVSVNGVVPPGSATPTQIRVTGRLTACGSNQVIVNTSISAQSQPVPIYPNGDFVVTLPVTTSVPCGTIVTVTAACYDTNTNQPDPNCLVQWTGALECCSIQIAWFDGIVPPGSLSPTLLRVVGTLKGCWGDQVIVYSIVSGQSQPTPVDPITGAFIVDLPLTSTVLCDSTVIVDAWCAQNPNCKTRKKGPVPCNQCARAQVSYTAGQCAGTPPIQPITFSSVINVPAGASIYMQWDFGDGTKGLVFPVNNTGGNANTPYSHSETHNYSPGSYTAKLCVTKPNGQPTECEKIPIAVTASCDVCPVTTVSASTPGSCVAGKRHLELSVDAMTLPPATPVVVAYWEFGDQTSNSNPFNIYPTSTFPLVPTTPHDYAAPPVGHTYVANLVIQYPANCASTPLSITIPPCAPPSCTAVVSDIQFQVSANCNPNGTRTVTATAVHTGTANEYTWQWDLTAASDPPVAAPAGKTQSHPYAAPGNASGTHKVYVTVRWTNGCTQTFSKDVTVDGCGGGCPSRVTDPSQEWTVTGNVTAPLAPDHYQTVDCDQSTVTMSVKVDTAGLPQSSLTYTWDFGDGTTISGPFPGPGGATQTHPFVNPTPGQTATYTITVTVDTPGCSPLKIPLTLTVPGCAQPPCPPGQHRDANGNCVPDGNGGGVSFGCILLLILALLFLAIAAGTGFIIGCAVAAGQPVNPWLVAISIVAFVLAVVFLLLWGFLCVRKQCRTYNWLLAILRVLVALSAVIALLLFLLRNPCSLGAVFGGGYIATFYAVAEWIGRRVGCITEK